MANKSLPSPELMKIPRPTPQQISAAIIAASKDKNKEPTFPQKLMSMLEPDTGYAGIIGWRNDGKSFYITKPDDLCDIVLPRVLGKHIKYMSFLRRLDRWGFKCEHIGSLWGTKLDVFSHPQFKRGFDCSMMIPAGEKERTKPIKRRKKSLKRKKPSQPRIYKGPKEPPLELQKQQLHPNQLQKPITALPKMMSPPTIPNSGGGDVLKGGFPLLPGKGMNPRLPTTMNGGVVPPPGPTMPKSRDTASTATLAGADPDMFGMAVEMEVSRRLRNLSEGATRPSFPPPYSQDPPAPTRTNAAVHMVHQQRDMDVGAAAQRRAALMAFAAKEEEEEEKTRLMLLERRREKQQLLAQLAVEQQREDEIVRKRMMIQEHRLANMRAAEEDRIMLQDEVAHIKFHERERRMAMACSEEERIMYDKYRSMEGGLPKARLPPSAGPIFPSRAPAASALGNQQPPSDATIDPITGASMFKKLPNSAHDKIITGAMLELKANQATLATTRNSLPPPPAPFHEGTRGVRPPMPAPTSSFYEDMMAARKRQLAQVRKEEFMAAADSGMYSKELSGMGPRHMPNVPPFY